MIEVGKLVQVFHGTFDRIKLMMLSKFNLSECTANSQILLVFNVKVFKMVYIEMFKAPAIWGELLSQWKFGATERGLLWQCRWYVRNVVFSAEKDKSWCWAWAAWCLSSQCFQLTWKIYWATTPSNGGSLNARSCKHAACMMSHNTINKIITEGSKHLVTGVIINTWDI